jgi:hypothetical protein
VNGFFARLACRRARIAPNSGSPCGKWVKFDLGG